MKKIMILITVSVAAAGSFAMLRGMHNRPLIHLDPPGVGAIEGRVVDREGNPVEAIEVVVAPTLTGLLLGAKTNKEGYFSVTAVTAGTHEVWTQENDSDLFSAGLFFSGGLPQRHVASVNVLRGQVTSNVVLETPPKFSKLTGRVLDATTNQPIAASQIILRRADHPDHYMRTGADVGGYFDIPIPAVAITVEVTSTGYQPWSALRDDPSPDLTRPVPLKPGRGESQKLEVRLRKKHL